MMRLTVCAWLLVACPALAQQPADLSGLWQAKKHLGPDLRGTLTVDRTRDGWRASIMGQTAPVHMSRDSVGFLLPSGDAFAGHVNARRNALVGHWLQGQRTASPLVLASCGTDCYRGVVVPLDEEFTFFLKVAKQPDGRYAAFLRNPERNLGHRWIPVRRLAVDGSNVRLLDARDSLVVAGVLHDDVLSVYIDGRGGSYDFRRVPDTAYTDFYARGRPNARYAYVPPRARSDGWPVATLDDVGIESDSIVAMIQRLISARIDSATAMQTHGLLIARHGKLVLEEYFFGEYADKPHNTRSATKSVLTVLLGAARQTGVKIGPETPVYAVMRPDAANLPAGKRTMTLDHLLTMSAAFDCDDSGDRPGDEDVITQQDTNPDWYGMILRTDLVRANGEKAVYCSLKPHLAGGVLARVAKRPLTDMLRELVTEPLDIQRYYVGLSPQRDLYFGGGHAFLLRDFAKFAQLFLNGGSWRGRRVLSREWIDRAVEPRYPMGRDARYGYLWWSRDYPYRGRTVKAYYMVGNGSQFSMYIPELDLVIGHYAGNYNDGSNTMLAQLIPQVILPAVRPVK